MNLKITGLALFSIFFVSCSEQPNFMGFWKGPHPEENHKKFYIHIGDSTTRGYWTSKGFYESEFDIKQLKIKNDSLSFFVPMWGCTYRGTIKNDNICGGFECPREPFDRITLKRHNEAANFLIYPKVECAQSGFVYHPPSKNLSKNEFQFVQKIINEIIQNRYGRLNSFIVSKQGRILCEEYFYGYTNNSPHPIESCTKSITSLLIGLAFDKGFISDLHQPLLDLFPEYQHLGTDDYKYITLHHLLCMTAGFKVDDQGVFGSDNRIKYALNREMSSKPGETFQYDGGCTEILGAILKRETGMFADEFARHYLFQPLEINNYNWEIHKQKGYPSMAGSLKLLPRDMLKIGQLLLHKGIYNERQVISAEWLKLSTTQKTITHIENDNYGYQWWNIQLGNEQQKAPVIWANGWGSQFIYIIPGLDVVICCTGYNYEQDSWAISKGIGNHLHLLK